MAEKSFFPNYFGGGEGSTPYAYDKNHVGLVVHLSGVDFSASASGSQETTSATYINRKMVFGNYNTEVKQTHLGLQGTFIGNATRLFIGLIHRKEQCNL